MKTKAIIGALAVVGALGISNADARPYHHHHYRYYQSFNDTPPQYVQQQRQPWGFDNWSFVRNAERGLFNLRHVLREGFGQIMRASWYGGGEQSCPGGRGGRCSSGARTANGEHFNPGGLTAAHRSLPFGTRLKVTNVRTGRSVVVRINDRGPNIKTGRSLDLSRGAARAIGMSGVASVRVARL